MDDGVKVGLVCNELYDVQTETTNSDGDTEPVRSTEVPIPFEQ